MIASRPLIICLAMLTLLPIAIPRQSPCVADEPAISYRPLSSSQSNVPQTLLGLFHASQVQQELGISGKMDPFLSTLQSIDGPWWASRNLPEAERRKVVANQEQLLIDAIEKNFGRSVVTRMRQLELQGQAYRMLLRPEIIAYVKLTANQSKELRALFDATDEVAKPFAKPGVPTAEEMKKLEQAKQEESEKAPKILTAEQQTKLVRSLGKILDTSTFERIFPMAPELIDSHHWVGDRRIRLQDTRGKVTLVHFYAFQCSNCIANFPVYNRWHSTLSERGVQVIGIQSPETKTERDPVAVAKAAAKDGFQFPVLIDIEMANWNAWSNTMWPTVYVVDKKGYIRQWWQGELRWQGATGGKTIEALVDKLLKE